MKSVDNNLLTSGVQLKVTHTYKTNLQHLDGGLFLRYLFLDKRHLKDNI